MTRLRARVAERLKGAQNTYAMLTTFNEIDMTNVMQLRKDFKVCTELSVDASGQCFCTRCTKQTGDVRPSVLSFTQRTHKVDAGMTVCSTNNAHSVVKDSQSHDQLFTWLASLSWLINTVSQRGFMQWQ